MTSTSGPGLPGRRRKIVDEERIACAVLAVGFENLTLTAVASQLGTTHGALYYHVKDRHQLVRLTADYICKEFDDPIPELHGWRETIAFRAYQLWDLTQRYPGLAGELTLHSDLPPRAAAMTEGEIEKLVDLGFKRENAGLAISCAYNLAFDLALRCDYYFQAHPDPDRDTTARRWFTDKLNVVLDGISVGLAPPE